MSNVTLNILPAIVYDYYYYYYYYYNYNIETRSYNTKNIKNFPSTLSLFSATQQSNLACSSNE
jgi:hypothetical protein